MDRSPAEPGLSLVGPTWTVTSLIDGGALSAVPAGAVATLVFRNDGSVDVNDGCNRGRGNWAATGTGIAISDLFLTKMACAGPGDELEKAVLEVLNQGSVQTWIEANVLTLQAGGRGLQLTGA